MEGLLLLVKVLGMGVKMVFGLLLVLPLMPWLLYSGLLSGALLAGSCGNGNIGGDTLLVV